MDLTGGCGVAKFAEKCHFKKKRIKPTFMNYFLHRIKGGDNAWPLAKALLNKGYLSIGWSDFSCKEYLEEIINRPDGIDKVFQKEYRFLPKNRWNLWRFICEMKPGDVILVPSPYTFSLYTIVDDTIFTNDTIDKALLIDDECNHYIPDEKHYLYNQNNVFTDIGFYRKVLPVQGGLDIPRWEYADAALTSRMKIRQTNARIDDLKESIDLALTQWKKQKPIQLQAILKENLAPQVLEAFHTIVSADKLELLVKQYMEAIGANLVETPSKNESPTEQGDADCVAHFDAIKVDILIQMKKHSGETDAWAIEQIKAFRANHDYGDNQVLLWIISTCDRYSDEALKEAGKGVRLITGKEFSEMILDAGTGFINV